MPTFPIPLIQIYEFCVEFLDGSFNEYPAHVIAESSVTQFDDDQSMHLQLDEMAMHSLLMQQSHWSLLVFVSDGLD